MVKPVGSSTQTDYAREKAYAYSKEATSPKEITQNRQGQNVILYNRGAERWAIAFDPKTGKEIKHTLFSADGSNYTEQKTSTGSILSFGNKKHIETQHFLDEKGQICHSVHYNSQGKPDATK